MWVEKQRKRPNEWLEVVLGVLGLAPSTYISQIIQKVLKGYWAVVIAFPVYVLIRQITVFTS